MSAPAARLARAALIGAHLVLLALMPAAWFAPILRAGLLPLFGLSEISIVSGLQALWGTDPALAILVSFLALFAPVAKLAGGILVLAGLLSARAAPALALLGRLAMADVFLIALYVVVVEGVGWATVETAWGLWLFTGCVLGALALGAAVEVLARRGPPGRGG